MSDLNKMKEVQEKINEILKDFKSNKILSKSEVMKYYRGLEITYDEFIERIEKEMLTELTEKDAGIISKSLEDF